MNRRHFLGVVGSATAAYAFAPYVRASNKSGLGPIVEGTGEHTYEFQHDWGQLPKGHAWGNTHGVCEDSQGRIYIKHTVHASAEVADAIVVFDENGTFIRSWGPEFKGGAHGLHINKEGSDEFLYLCDPARGLMVKTTLDGKDAYRLSCPMESGCYNDPGEYHPTNVAVAPNGDVYVADGYGKSWIHRYNRKGEYVSSFGGPGSERAQTSCSHGLMVDTRGTDPVLTVADRSNRRIQVFSLDGKHLAFYKDDVRSPCHFHTRADAMVVPDLEARVTILDSDYKPITHLGDGTNYGLRGQPRDQFIPGKFIAPHSAIFDHAGNIFVVEWVEVGRVTKLKKLS